MLTNDGLLTPIDTGFAKDPFGCENNFSQERKYLFMHILHVDLHTNVHSRQNYETPFAC